MTAHPPAAPDADWHCNNFDLIRLFAALQVATVHTISNLKPGGLGVAIFDAGLRFFPGVPIFFLISGLLISRSYERCGPIADYYRNRCLRIFPGLWVCLVASIAVLAVKIQVPGTVGAVSAGGWLLWWGAQMTVFQQYAPAFLHGVRLNGSLWTIPVELEFYLLLPGIYGALRLRKRRGDRSLLALLALSAALHWVLVKAMPDSRAATYGYLLDTVLPYLWMFLTGVLIQRNWNRLRRWFAGQAHWWLLCYVLACAVSREYFKVGVGSADITLLFLLPLAGVVMSCAVSAPALSSRILAHNDISYGTYIYHILVVGLMLQLGATGNILSVLAAVAIAACLGTLSWFCIERPFLRQKQGALRTLKRVPRRATQPLAPETLRGPVT